MPNHIGANDQFSAGLGKYFDSWPHRALKLDTRAGSGEDAWSEKEIRYNLDENIRI